MKKNTHIVPNNSFTEFLLYTTPNGKVKVEIFLRDENIWLTQAKIAELFGVDRSVVTKHLQNIFQEGELHKEATCAKIAQVQYVPWFCRNASKARNPYANEGLGSEA